MARLSKTRKKEKIQRLSAAVYQLIAEFVDSDKRLHLSNAPCNLRYKEPKDKVKQRWASAKKPWGLWYGFGSSWMEWSVSEYACMLRPYVYEVVIKDESRILKISNDKEFEEFEEKYWANNAMIRQMREQFNLPDTFDLPYGLMANRMMGSIDWPLVAKSYAACEINPYLYSKRLESLWYYGWDCASGCIWDASVLELKLVAAYDEGRESYVRCS